MVFLTTGSLPQELESWSALAGLPSTSKTPLILSLSVPVCVGPGDHPTVKSVGNSSHCHLTSCLSGPNSLLLQDLRLCSIDWRCLQSINTKREVGGRCWGQKRCTLERPSLGCRLQSAHFSYCRGCVWPLEEAIWAVLLPTTLYMFLVDRARGMKRIGLCRPKS